MKIDLPRVGAPRLDVCIYRPSGMTHCVMSSEFENIEIENDTYLIIIEVQTASKQPVGCWAFDRIQWLPYKPEYHNPERLAPKPKSRPKLQPKPIELIEKVAVEITEKVTEVQQNEIKENEINGTNAKII